MIQRIQSLYLLLSAILSSVLLFTPLSDIRLAGGVTLKYFSYGFQHAGQTGNFMHSALPIIFLLAIVSVVSFVCIFLYKKRKIQIRLCWLSILLLILLAIIICLNYYSIQQEFGTASASIIGILIIPVLNILALLMAYRGIHKDELLVKSYDRLR
jgi:hypothetical protein